MADTHREDIDRIRTDVLVIGSEGAGGHAAIEVHKRGLDVILATKGIMGGSGATLTAPYSCLVAFGHEDSRDNPDVHFQDTVIEGWYLSNQRVVEAFTQTAPQAILNLESWGCKFDKHPDGRFRQEVMPGCTYPRAVFFDFTTGKQFRKGLLSEVKRRGIRLHEDLFIADVLVDSQEGRVAGALAVDLRTGQFVAIEARAVVIATGGSMELYYPYTDAPGDLTGDGIAMAYRAGADLMDMEFLQFFPTCAVWPPPLMANLYVGMLRYKLPGRLYNIYGERFLHRYDPEHMEFTTRDRMAIAIATEILQGRGSPHGGVYLDVSHLPDNIIEAFVDHYFPGWNTGGVNLLEIGVDLRRNAVEVAPMAHFQMGGVRINERTETTVPGLYASGEAAAGVHGANRLEGNALSETQAMGLIAGIQAATHAARVEQLSLPGGQVRERVAALAAPLERTSGERYHGIRKELQKIMWRDVGLLRNQAGLERAKVDIDDLAATARERLTVAAGERRYNREWFEALETLNLLDEARVMVRSALERTESRGAHYRLDFPQADDAWLLNLVARRDGDQVAVERTPLVITTLPPNTAERPAAAVAGNPFLGD